MLAELAPADGLGQVSLRAWPGLAALAKPGRMPLVGTSHPSTAVWWWRSTLWGGGAAEGL